MPKLSEIKTEDNFKLLIMGEPGEGKTVLACSFPGPTLLLDFDGKADSAAQFYKGQDLVNNIEVEELAATLVDDPIERLNHLVDKVLIPQQRAGKMEYKTIILDSITTFSRAALKHIVKTNPSIKRVSSTQGLQPGMQDYGILRRVFAELIPGILSLPCNVIMTAHIDAKKDDLTGEISRGPVMDGSFSQELAIYFKEVWVLSTDKGKRMAQTQSNYKFKCRSQIKGLPEKLDVTNGYESIKQYLS